MSLSRQLSSASTSSSVSSRARSLTLPNATARPTFYTPGQSTRNHSASKTKQASHLRDRSYSRASRPSFRKRAVSSPSTVESVQSCATRRWSTVIGDLSWEGLFPHLTSRGRRTLFEDQLYWKLLQRRVPVNGYLKPKPGNSLACPRCGDSKETIEHWAYECVASREFWDHWRAQVSKLVGVELPEVTLRDIVGLFPDVRGKLDPEAMHALTVAHGTALWSLWGSRAYTSVDTCPSYAFYLARLRARIFVEYNAACEYNPRHITAMLSAQLNSAASSPTSVSGDESSDELQAWTVNRRFLKRWCGKKSDVGIERGWIRFGGEWGENQE
ncbi:hypothetical protein HDV00_005042 [Rhizophlyctis rosea]|nr:hypothetical protein HDV00_005042 [Rhizophlyctis rosea]